MADGLAVAELVEVRFDSLGGDGEILVQEAEEAGRGRAVTWRLSWIQAGDELDAIAGGEDEGFADAGLMSERADGVGQAGRWNGEALAASSGAVVWLTPTRTSEPSGAGSGAGFTRVNRCELDWGWLMASGTCGRRRTGWQPKRREQPE